MGRRAFRVGLFINGQFLKTINVVGEVKAQATVTTPVRWIKPNEVVVEEDFTLSPDPMPEEVIFIRSDQYSFVKKGVPAVFLVPGFTSTDPEIDGSAVNREHRQTHYHQPSDDLSRPIDWDSALRFARANVRIGHAVAEDDERPTWNEGDFFGEKFAR